MSNKTELARQVTDDSLKVDLGDDGTDEVTGFAGTVTAVTLFDRGSARVMLETMVNGEIKQEWFDAARVI